MASPAILNSYPVPSQHNRDNILVVIDSAVNDYQLLMKGIQPAAQVIILDNQQDGITQITTAIHKNSITSLQLIAHGSSGSLQLGNTALNLKNLHTYQQQLKQWQVADILIYGCEVAAAETGKTFLNQLHQLTGANIAASTGKVGNSQQGGSWELVVKIGLISSSLVIKPEVQQNYPNVLMSVNNAPILDNTGNLTFTAITEDVLAANNSGNIVADIINSVISDIDTSAVKGIAVTYVDNSNGTWQYTLNGTTWNNFGSPNLATARLLGANATTKIRFLPNANFSGTSEINFYAWDQTTGTAGSTANILTGTGGTKAFSTAYEGASITVTSVNDTAPTLTAGTPTLQNIDEDTPLISNKGSSLADLINGLISDSDPDPQGIAVTGVDNSNGKWQYSLDGGTNWIDFGTVSDNSATVLSARVKLYDGSLNNLPTPQGWLKFGTSAAILPLLGVGGTESLISGGTQLNSNTTASSPFTQLNGTSGYSNYNSYTPVLFNQFFPELDPVTGFTVSFDVKINSNQNTSDDNDDSIIDRAGFSVIVVTKDQTKAIELGFWTDEIWAQTATPLFTHSTTERAFRDTTTTPATRYDLVIENNTYTLFAAGSSNPILSGNLRDYSAFNHTTGAPSPINSLPYDPYETPNFIFFGDGTTSATAISELTRIELQTKTRVRFVPDADYNGQASLTFRAWDESNGVASGTTGVNAAVNGSDTAFSSNTQTTSITVNSVNDAPAIANSIADQIATAGSAFNFTFAADTFNDVDIQDTLIYIATLENGDPLPNWLTFDSNTRNFTGTPPTNGNFNIKVTAKDQANASVEDVFVLTVAPLQITQLVNSTNDIFQISSFQKTTKLQVSLTGRNSQLVNELAVFTVDDDNGTINGIAPGAAGYIQAAIARSAVIFSAIANIPNGFDSNNLTRTLEFSTNEKFRFALIKNNTFDAVKAGSASSADIVFSDTSSQKITDLGNNVFSLGWRDSSNNNVSQFNNLVVNVQATDNLLPLGTGLQNNSQGEMIDLRGISGAVNAEFSVYREASYDSFVGFYQVTGVNGGIDTNNDGVDDLLPGQAGYTQAAINQRVAGINLTVNNQATATYNSSFSGGGIFVPFIIVNGRPEALLDSNTSNDPAVYFPFLGANSDKSDHIRLLGNNVFGFEDLANLGDKDYNDVIVKVDLSITRMR